MGRQWSTTGFECKTSCGLAESKKGIQVWIPLSKILVGTIGLEPTTPTMSR